MTDVSDDVKLWRTRAAELRAMAERCRDATGRRQLRIMADTYDSIAASEAARCSFGQSALLGASP